MAADCRYEGLIKNRMYEVPHFHFLLSVANKNVTKVEA